MKTEMTCIVCPMGCRLEVTHEDNKVISVTGNTCKRGEKYAETEIKAPTRNISTTVALKGGSLKRLPVKTSCPIDKGAIFDVINALKDVEAKAPVKIGDVIVRNICKTGADIVSTINAC